MDPVRLYNRSLALLYGTNVAKDEKRSFELNAEAAASGHRDAVLAMGWYYLNGVGVAKDANLAKQWYRRSARQKDPRAMFSLGQIAYAEGMPEEALTWFERASSEGHARSLYWLAKMYARGDGVERNSRKAQALIQEAASKRDPEARRVLRFLSWRSGRRGEKSSGAA